MSGHLSRRDGLRRLLCTACWSAAVLIEERGADVVWAPGWSEADGQVEGGLW
ncbi:hypothetical protein [Streptomyces bacillaris]|uniref:hypothetical protein n=1 Tax=Streptomyces bacillaris TaxID=68179 RepID=UPI003624C1BD